MPPISLPSDSACPAVPAGLPSSTTRTVAVGRESLIRRSTRSMFSDSLYVGSTTRTSIVPAYGEVREAFGPGRSVGRRDLVRAPGHQVTNPGVGGPGALPDLAGDDLDSPAHRYGHQGAGQGAERRSEHTAQVGADQDGEEDPQRVHPDGTAHDHRVEEVVLHQLEAHEHDGHDHSGGG